MLGIGSSCLTSSKSGIRSSVQSCEGLWRVHGTVPSIHSQAIKRSLGNLTGTCVDAFRICSPAQCSSGDFSAAIPPPANPGGAAVPAEGSAGEPNGASLPKPNQAEKPSARPVQAGATASNNIPAAQPAEHLVSSMLGAASTDGKNAQQPQNQLLSSAAGTTGSAGTAGAHSNTSHDSAEPLEGSSIPPPGQRPFLPLRLLSFLEPSLTVFILGGAAVSAALVNWAKGSPLRRSHPYEFTIVFEQASKVAPGTQVRMKGVQIGSVRAVSVDNMHAEVVAEVADARNVIPRGSRVDVNQLGLASDPYVDITPPDGTDACDLARSKAHGPHHARCDTEGVIVCNGGRLHGRQGGSLDFMMKVFLAQQERARPRKV